MIKSVFYSILFFSILIFSCTPKKNSEEFSQKETVVTEDGDFMKDWFLATGDWSNDPQLYVREFGSGRDTIILLHGGWGGDHEGMIEMVEGLKDEYKFFTYEQRGSLRSPFPDSLITFQHHIQDLELLRKELDLNTMTVVGHSMGTVLASAYASQYPSHIKKLVLISPVDLKNPYPEEEQVLYKASYAKYESFSKRPEVETEFRKNHLLRQNPPLTSKEETIKDRINFASMMMYDVSKWNKLSNGRALFKSNVFALTQKTYPKDGWDYIEEFKKHSYPISMIIGDHDRFDFGNPITEKWSKEVPRTTFVSLQNAGHMIWIDQPEELTKILRQQLQ